MSSADRVLCLLQIVMKPLDIVLLYQTDPLMIHLGDALPDLPARLVIRTEIETGVRAVALPRLPPVTKIA